MKTKQYLVTVWQNAVCSDGRSVWEENRNEKSGGGWGKGEEKRWAGEEKRQWIGAGSEAWTWTEADFGGKGERHMTRLVGLVVGVGIFSFYSVSAKLQKLRQLMYLIKVN